MVKKNEFLVFMDAEDSSEGLVKVATHKEENSDFLRM